MKQKNYLKLSLICSTLFLLISCGAVVKSKANKHITEENGAIPPNFGKNNSTLLFVTHRRSYNKYLKRNVKSIYQGKYELVTKEELNTNSKYNDLNNYRYLFDYEGKTFSYVNSDGRNKTGEVKKFYILDRKNNDQYYSKMTSGFWSKLQKVYLKKLNEKILK